MASIRERVKAFINPPESRSLNTLKGSFAGMLGTSESGINITEETALTMSAVWSCIRLLSEMPGSFGIDTYEETGNKRTPIDHQVKELIMKPNEFMIGFTWSELMNAWLQGWGNGISLIDNAGNGTAKRLIPLHPKGVEAVMSDNKVFYKVNDEKFNIKGTFYPEEVVHYKMFSTDGLWGKSPIQVAKENIGLGLAAERFGAKFFAKGGNLKSVIEVEGNLKDEEFKQWKKRWDAYYSGSAGDHTTPILEYGMKYKPLGIPPEQAQFVATRMFQLTEICRIFNVPPHLIGDLSRATFSNIEHQDIQFVKYTLRPLLRRQELELEEKLLLPKEKGKIKIRYNLDGMLRGDLAAQTTHIKEMVLSGVMTRNEGRRILNLNPITGGDELFVPANIVGNNNNLNNGQN